MQRVLSLVAIAAASCGGHMNMFVPERHCHSGLVSEKESSPLITLKMWF
jgi:hypothetical protein